MAMGLAESKSGRTAAQVVANLGAASMFAAAAGSVENAACRAAMIAGMVAAMAEATADTLASELGETFRGRVRLITTWRQVPPGTDGGVSLKGTLVAILGAAIIVLICLPTMRLSLHDAAICLLAAIIGLFIDSFLGVILEARSYLTNNKVNFLSTMAAGLIAAAFIFWSQASPRPKQHQAASHKVHPLLGARSLAIRFHSSFDPGRRRREVLQRHCGSDCKRCVECEKPRFGDCRQL
jgi:uncharacterized protein (TIGR00297 family)